MNNDYRIAWNKFGKKDVIGNRSATGSLDTGARCYFTSSQGQVVDIMEPWPRSAYCASLQNSFALPRALVKLRADMLTPKMQQLAAYKAKIEKLEKSISDERAAVLRRLHADAGFASRDELIAALRGLGGGGGGGRRGPKPGAATGRRGKGGRKKRATITPELRNQIIAAVKAGGTGNAVADKYGVSLPTVQNIKRDAGLTKKRKGK